MNEVADRNEQFERIATLKADYQEAGNPVVSMDTKKKERIGNFYRDGSLYTTAEVHTYDHDFPSYADGIIIPHAFYDLQQNKGFINIGTSRDTSEFACDSFRNWWQQQGQHDYPDATSILVFCDGGGSNSARHYIFKQDLAKRTRHAGRICKTSCGPSTDAFCRRQPTTITTPPTPGSSSCAMRTTWR